MNKWLKPLLGLVFLILICAVSVRLLTGGETLDQYAAANPEIAYATPDKTEAPSPSPSVSPTASPTSSPDFHITDTESAESTHFADGFFYQPLTDAVVARITGISYPVSETIAPALSLQATNIVSDEEEIAISYEELSYMNVLYYDFNGEVQTGELICNQKIAQDLIEIFYELYQNEY